MRTAYCEMKRGGLTVERRSRRSRTEAQRRKLVRVRENIGAAMMLLGFLLLMVIGGAEDLTVIFLGGLAAHRFYLGYTNSGIAMVLWLAGTLVFGIAAFLSPILYIGLTIWSLWVLADMVLIPFMAR